MTPDDIAALDRLVAWKGPHKHREFGVGQVKDSIWTCWVYDRHLRPQAICSAYEGDDLTGKVNDVLRLWELLERKKEDYQV